MNALYRIFHITQKEVREMWRNAGIVSVVLAIPIIEMFVLGYATAGSVVELPAAVYNADHSPVSRRLAETIHHSRSFEVVWQGDEPGVAERMLEKGSVYALFVIPAGFERSLSHPADKTVVAAVIDGSNTAVAGYAAGYAEQVIGHFTALREGQISIEPRIWFNQELRRANFYVPALLGTMLSLVALSLTAISIVRERERGTLEQMFVSPVRPLELIIAKLLPVVLIAYVELALMLVIAVQVFDVPIRGSLSLYAGLMFAYLLAEMGVGMLISTLAINQAQALPTIFLLVTMNSILAGFIVPVETMPVAAQKLSAVVPLSYFVTITRELFAKGAGFQELASQLYPLLGMGVVLFTASTLLLRRRLV